MKHSQFEQWLQALSRDRTPGNNLAVPLLQSADLLGDPSQVSAWLDLLPLGIAIYQTDGSAVFFNRVAQETIGIPTDIPSNDAAGSTLAAFPIFKAGTERLYPAEALPMSRALCGESCTADDLEIRRAGRSVLLEARAVPLSSNQGEVIGCVAVFQDITLRRQAERSLSMQNQALRSEIAQKTDALRRCELETQALLNAIPDLIFRVSSEGIYLSYLKTNHLIDLVQPEVNPVGMHVSQLLPPEVAQLKLQHLK